MADRGAEIIMREGTERRSARTPGELMAEREIMVQKPSLLARTAQVITGRPFGPDRVLPAGQRSTWELGWLVHEFDLAGVSSFAERSQVGVADIKGPGGIKALGIDLQKGGRAKVWTSETEVKIEF